jgi:hypothetical protein
MRRLAIGLVAAMIPTAMLAGPFDGLYRPDGLDGWDCQSVGQDGGALSVQDDTFHGVENLCRLTNPVPVTGMDAILYDADCAGEGETYRYRMMLMRLPEGLAVIEDGYVNVLKRCN